MKKVILIGAKLLLSAGLVWYAFSKIDAESAIRELRNLSSVAIVSVLILLIGQFALASWRLMLLLRQTSRSKPSYATALDAVVVGAFFSQTLISFVGGDAMRVWRITRQEIDLGSTMRAVLLDRVLGFVGLIILIVSGIPVLFEIVEDRRVHAAIVLLVVAAVAGCVAIVSAPHFPAWVRAHRLFSFVSELSSVSRAIVRSFPIFGILLGISLAIQVLNVGVIYALGQGLNAGIGLVHCLVLVPPVLFLSMMPISFAGWGVRESAMVASLTAVGVAPAQSLAMSISYGLAMILISLPGGLLWFYNRSKLARGSRPAPRI